MSRAKKVTVVCDAFNPVADCVPDPEVPVDGGHGEKIRTLIMEKQAMNSGTRWLFRNIMMGWCLIAIKGRHVKSPKLTVDLP